MGINKKEIKEHLLASIPRHFVDPITNLKPSGERELSALLGLFHLKDLVKWDQVPLYNSDNTLANKSAKSIIAKEGILSCEYPLFAANEQETNIWGEMISDLLYIHKEASIIAIIENKIGSNFTSGGNDVDTGQLARQSKYLIKTGFTKKYLLILSSKEFFNADWYCAELRKTLFYENRYKTVDSYLIAWEDIFKALIQWPNPI